ncbi:MAG TPA: hypothetical protein PKV16_02155 [Caldisericia bacterium]|nr:hypothetical protein [Caldisericia bacterium]HPF48116.1 hypothetical protein [Caldisericia bacterium]HPI83947.1 hypothetical protein [Caldisericia bacterium]HPQ92569.1 hypothetical protein [Caldisericia bacterium]HRV74333.1 hypothetical protein [Caldisericia bacterium]
MSDFSGDDVHQLLKTDDRGFLDSMLSDIALREAKEKRDLTLDSIASLFGSTPVLSILSFLPQAVRRFGSLRDVQYLKKFCSFLAELDGLSYIDRKNFVDRYNNNEEERKKTDEAVLLILEKYNDYNKASLMGVFLKAWVMERIGKSTFFELSFSIDNCLLFDIRILVEYMKSRKESGQYNISKIYGASKSRLTGAGFIKFSNAVSGGEAPSELAQTLYDVVSGEIERLEIQSGISSGIPPTT